MVRKKCKMMLRGLWKRCSPENVMLVSMVWVMLMSLAMFMVFIHMLLQFATEGAGWLTFLQHIGLGFVFLLLLYVGMFFWIVSLIESCQR
ncbi:MAG TPA: hypothetical protein PLH67_14980 [Lentisphaeria bacterium]|nr:hypothetical protein [Lentisphaeria bacterium]